MYSFHYIAHEAMPGTDCAGICEQISVVEKLIGSYDPLQTNTPPVSGKILALIHSLRVGGIDSAYNANRSGRCFLQPPKKLKKRLIFRKSKVRIN